MNYTSLLSCSCSSSSTISRLVCAHEQVAHVNEVHTHQDSGITPNGLSPPLPLPAGYRAYRSRQGPQPHAHWLYHVYKTLPARVRKAAFRDFYRRSEGLLKDLETTGPYTLCYDTSRNLARAELLRTVLPDLKVIHVMKNPYEFIATNLGANNCNHVRLLDEWLRYNEAAVAYERVLGPNRYLKIHFESFVHTPNETAKKLFSFLQLDFSGTDSFTTSERASFSTRNLEIHDTCVPIEPTPQTWKEVLSKRQIHFIDRSILKHDWALAVP